MRQKKVRVGVFLSPLAARVAMMGQERRGPDSGEFPRAFSPDGEQRLQLLPEVMAGPLELVGSPWVAAVKVGTEVGREVTSEGTAEGSHVKGVPRSRETGEWGGTSVGIGNRTLSLTSSWRGGSLWGPSWG